MQEKVAKMLNDSVVARWAALILIALMMFFAYMFVDVMSPLKSLVESARGWDSGAFGTYAASEYILNVCGFLILAGIILDKMGIRFTGVLSASLMVIGASIKFVGISEWFQTTGMCAWLDSWWTAMPGSAKMASLGFMVFGCGCEMAGTTVSKSIAKWFKGKEMALAMGLEMAIARLGVFAVMWLAPIISNKFDQSVVAPVGFCTVLLLIGLINYIVFSVMDSKLDKQLVAAGMATEEKSPEDEFHIKDLGKIFSSKMFWLVALPALRALLFGYLPVPEICSQLPGDNSRGGQCHSLPALQLLPDPGHVSYPAARYLPGPQGQGCHYADARSDYHDCMPSVVCFRAAALSS